MTTPVEFNKLKIRLVTPLGSASVSSESTSVGSDGIPSVSTESLDLSAFSLHIPPVAIDSEIISNPIS